MSFSQKQQIELFLKLTAGYFGLEECVTPAVPGARFELVGNSEVNNEL
jgi:hypothetical protein